MKRIGMYGGTFSPPHNGHLHALRVFRTYEELDSVIVMPTYSPPHKARDFYATAEDCYQMALLAFSNESGTVVSDLELRRQGKSYTALTLQQLTDDNTRVVLLCGTDMFLTLNEWYRPDIIFQLADVVCMPRTEGQQEQDRLEECAECYRRQYGAQVRILPEKALVMSSTVIREALKKGDFEAASFYIPDDVLAYIKEKGLYR